MISFANLVTNYLAPEEIFEMLKSVSVPTPEAWLAKPQLTGESSQTVVVLI